MQKYIATIALTFVVATCGSSFGILDFSDWDHSLISNGGQTFTDICGDIDVTVESIGKFDAPSTFRATSTGPGSTGPAIRSRHDVSGSHSFRFTFSEPLELQVLTRFVDASEMVGVYGIGPEVYTQTRGSAASEAIDGSGLKIQGTGYGVNSADGYVTVGPTHLLTLTYGSMNGSGGTKYNEFNIAKVVPEPNSLSLLGIGALALFRRKRRR